MERFKTYGFADDLAILIQGILKIKEIIITVENWCLLNSMQLNKLKSGILILSSKTTFTTFEIQNKDILGIPFVLHYKYLGILFDKMLHITPHLKAL